MIVIASEERQQLAQAERACALDDILSRWHWWRSSYRAERGYSPGGQATAEYRTPLSFNSAADADEAVDAGMENNLMRQVDFEISELPDPYRSAIGALARSLCVGAGVFRSPRIPEDQWETVIGEARQMLSTRLLSAGVL